MDFQFFHCTFHCRYSLSVSIANNLLGLEEGSLITPKQSLRTQIGADYFAVQVSKVIELHYAAS